MYKKGGYQKVSPFCAERECWDKVLSPEFEGKLKKLGEGLDLSEDTPLPAYEQSESSLPSNEIVLL